MVLLPPPEHLIRFFPIQGTPVEAALPVDCEVKAKKAAGKGGLVLVMHASEMADGNQWQKVIAKLPEGVAA